VTDTVRQAIAILDDARTLLEKGWTSCALARDEQGIPCDPKDTRAVCWCVTGALLASVDAPPDLIERIIAGRASDADRLALGEAFALVRRTLQAANGGYALVFYNDTLLGKRKCREEAKVELFNWIGRAMAVLKAGAS